MKISKSKYKSTYSGLTLLLITVCCMAMATSCGGKSPYKIDGTVEGLGTQNVTAIYHDGTSLKEVSTNAVNSVFHLEGFAEQPIVIELYDNQRRRIGCIAASNGEDIKVKYKVGEPYFMEASGSKLSTSLGDFLKKNATGLNGAIERQITAAPGDELSALLAGYYYDISEDAVRADSILSLIDNSTITGNAILRSKSETASRMATQPGKVTAMELFSSADSIVSYEPSSKTNTLYIFTDVTKMPDSIVEYADSVAREIRVASIRLSIDTFGWHKDALRFPKKVDHLWALGGVANEQLRCFNIPAVPYFVVADTAFNQIYRGTSLPVMPQ